MQQYQFEKIFSQMGKEMGRMVPGEEDRYSLLLFPLEGNVLKIHREFPSSNSRRLREAIALALFDIRDRYTGQSTDTSAFRTVENERLEQALLMAFDPFTNDDVRNALADGSPATEISKDALKSYYRIPCMCLLRIKDSIDTLEVKNGSDGYFVFIEDWMGHLVKDQGMNYSVVVKADADGKLPWSGNDY